MSSIPEDVGSSYSDADILAAVKAGRRVMRFRYERLGLDLGSIDYIDTVVGGRVSYNYLADVKRTASFTIAESTAQEIDYANQLVRPYVGFLMPDGLWSHIPVGTFLLASPGRRKENGVVLRDVKAYDLMLILRQNYTATRYQVASGAVITTAIGTVLDGLHLASDIPASTKTAPADRAWDPGTSWGVIVNDLLAMIGYGSLWFTPMGVATSGTYVPPANRAVDFSYATDEASILSEHANELLDFFDIPNTWVFTVSQPDRAVLTSTYTNSDPLSMTSTVRRGRTITKIDVMRDEADQAALDAAVQKQAQEDSQVYDEISVETALNPLHDESATVMLTHEPLGLEAAAYTETGWEYDLKAGAPMAHTLRKAVAV